MSDILIETETLRVRVIRDEHPDEPYDDGGSPILSIEWGRPREIRQITATTSYEVADDIISAAYDAESEEELEAYLRDHHGVTQVVWFTDHPVSYVSFDPADWRELQGLTADHLAKHPDARIVNVDEYRAWLEGECFGYVLEERVTWRRVDDHAATAPTTWSRKPDALEDMTTWETVESCWGFYGREWVDTEARRVFTEVATERGLEVPA